MVQDIGISMGQINEALKAENMANDSELPSAKNSEDMDKTSETNNEASLQFLFDDVFFHVMSTYVSNYVNIG